MNKREFHKLLRYDFSSFVKKTFHTINPGARYVHNWHIDAMAEYLEACEKGEIKRLIIAMPPRYLKSVVCSVSWPAWLLGHDPSRRVIVSSYAQSLANKHSLDCRLVMEQEWYRQSFPAVEFSNDQNEKHKYVTTKRGYRLAVSTGGSVTGEGGNYLIVDDIHNPVNVMSNIRRQSDIVWYEHVFSSRLDDKKEGVFIVVMQRLHQDDLVGHLLKKQGWEYLALPAVSEERSFVSLQGHVLKVREAGEPLHVGREGDKELAQIREDLGNYAYLAQYQQQPVSASEAMVKIDWFRRYEAGRAFAEGYIVQSWDTAIKSQAQHDSSVCTTWYIDAEEAYLLDVMCDKLEYPELKKRVVQLAEKWKPSAVLIEDKASGQSLLQDLRRESVLPLIAIMPKKDKVTRLASVSAMVERGNIWLPKEAHWLARFEDELLSFPNGKHDDQVDSMSQCLNWLREKRTVRPTVRTL